MQTILVPTDFSDTARNAARYAIEFAKQVSVKKIIFYNACQAPYTADPTMPVVQLFDFEGVKAGSEEGLNRFKNELLPHTPAGIELATRSEFALLAESIVETCEETGADLIIIGITGGGGIDVLVGSNTVSVADHSKIPVIIVPLTTLYKPIESMVLVWDFKKIGETTPIALIKKILDETHARLHILNIDHNHTGKAPHHDFMADQLLQAYNPQYHYVDSKSFSEATNEFVDNNQVDMIITIPKKHGFFENIFRPNHTKQLAFHSHVPLMCIHEI